MTLKKYLFLMILATLLCWGSLVLVLFFVDPDFSGIIGILIFYFATFFAVLGSASIIGFLIRYIFQKREYNSIKVKNSFRQGIWFGLLVVISLFLQSRELVAWWNLLLLIIILSVLELFMLSLNKRE